MVGINIDYLIINGLQKEQKDLDNLQVFGIDGEKSFSCLVLEYGTKIFRKVAKVYFKGKEFGTLCWQPYDGMLLDKAFCTFQLANVWLYQHVNKTKDLLQDFFTALGIIPTGLNRLDIAIDASRDLNFFNPVLYRLEVAIAQEDILITGKEKSVVHHTTTKGKKTGCKIGDRGSDRLAKFYNKSFEMNNKVFKPHILEYWKDVLLIDDTSNVWRFEMQLNRRFLKEIDDIWRIFDYNFLLSIFCISVEKWLDIRENCGLSREYRNPKIEVFRMEYFQEFLNYSTRARNQKEDQKGQFYTPCRASNANGDKSILQNKISLKKMFFRYLNSDQNNLLPLYFIKEIFDINPSYYELEFFGRKKFQWIEDFTEKHNQIFAWNGSKFQNDLDFIATIQNPEIDFELKTGKNTLKRMGFIEIR